ncbi:hypothetical protein D3C86_1112400 [compost metagenome]
MGPGFELTSPEGQEKKGFSMACFVRRIVMSALAFLPLVAAPAQAALVNTYSATDDAWSAPIPSGHFLLDVRAAYAMAKPSQLALPVATLAYGLAPDVEVGAWGAYTFTDLGGTGETQGPVALAPYLKFRLPWTLGATGFGVVAGAQLPTQAGMERTIAVEGVAAIPLSRRTSLDLGLGVGRAFLTPTLLTHANAALYHSLPGGWTLLAEAFAYAPSVGVAGFGQRVGGVAPLAPGVLLDLSMAVNEGPAGLSGIVPQLGATWAW